MATATLLDIDESLNTSYRPDREYSDGELRERNVGKLDHARVQYLLSAWLENHEADWALLAAPNSGRGLRRGGGGFPTSLSCGLRSSQT